MKGWRLVVAGLLACAALAARPAAALDDGSTKDGVATSDDVALFDEGTAGGDTWEKVGWGALTGLSNLVYIPVKVGYAVLGGVTGGLALGLTGGDVDTASGVWEPSLGGDYFLTPSMIQGEESFSFAGAAPTAGLGAPLPDDRPAGSAPGDRPAGSAPPDDQHFGG
jgi:hypothetical protein